MYFAEELRASLQESLASGTIQIRETGNRITCAGPLSWEVRGAPAKPLVHLWAENCNITRRVLAIANQSDDELSLAVERFGRVKPDRLVLVRLEYTRSARRLSREDFCDQLRRILAEQFPEETIEKISIAPDLEHSLSGVYARGISRRGSARYVFLAVSESESQDSIESSLSYAVLWLHRCLQTADSATISALRLIVPQGQSILLAHRLRALTPRLTVHIYEHDAVRETLSRVDPCAIGNVATCLVPRRELQLLQDRASPALARIHALAPGAITVHPSSQTQEVVLRFRGLPFARWSEGRVFFGIDPDEQRLTSDTEPLLKRLVAGLDDFRNPLARETRHVLYRLQAERWLQAMVLHDVARIDISLDPAHLYEQVFAQVAGQHGILDLLGVTRAGRLAILELKATEDLNLPLQAADYWSRIRLHQAQGDLIRYGYFSGLELQPVPPLVYLVAPVLRFHPTTDMLLRYLSPEMEVVRIGLAESWRRGLRVVMRH